MACLADPTSSSRNHSDSEKWRILCKGNALEPPTAPKLLRSTSAWKSLRPVAIWTRILKKRRRNEEAAKAEETQTTESMSPRTKSSPKDSSANPPFNDSDITLRGSTFLQSEASPQVVSAAKDNFRKDDDVRCQFGVPPKGNANFAWVQHFIHHLTPQHNYCRLLQYLRPEISTVHTD